MTSSPETRLVFDDVVKTYGGRTVVNHLTLALGAGTIAALAGINGSGKSTLFRIAAGFVTPTGGSVAIAIAHEVEQIAGDPSQRIAKGLQYLSQDRRLLYGLSTLENLRIAKAAVSRSARIQADEIFDGLAELRLTFLLDTKPSQMKPADIARLLLAKAYLLNPRFLLVDEPFAGLGRLDIDHCVAILQRMRDRGTGILITDHNWKPILQIADTVHIMKDGSLVYSDSAVAARSSSAASRLYFRKHA